jgi:hypothetical protein
MVYKFNIKRKLETGLIFIKPLNRFVRVWPLNVLYLGKIKPQCLFSLK